MKVRHIRRLRILYILLLILIGISVLPLWFYGSKMVSMNKDKLETDEKILQVTISQSLAQIIPLYMDNLQGQLKAFFEEVGPQVAQIKDSNYDSDRPLLVSVQRFVTERPTVIYATVLNKEARGVQAGGYNVTADAFLRKALEAGFRAAQLGQHYQSNPITIVRSDGASEPVMVMGRPINARGQFIGMVAAVVTLSPILDQLKKAHEAGLEAYIVDRSGRLIASNSASKNFAGLEMASTPIVAKFLDWRGRARATETSVFDLVESGKTVRMVGTYSPIPSVNWGVIVQRPAADAFFTVREMKRQTTFWGLLVTVLSLVVGVVSAKSVTRPIDQLRQSARSIAQRDFSQRADVRSHTEIGELAQTFNLMADDIQRYIGDLTAASDKNRQLFIDSIEMIAAAVDAKDPYTKGHSGRVAQYSVILARELGLSDGEIEKVRIAAILHDVGKIGIEDRVLKKPGLLTDEEFEIMKRHTVMGYDIVRQVKQLAEMVPGIRWHHESFNGKGYPDGIEAEEIPLMARIISVADTLDAVTTDRPYQAACDFGSALAIVRKHAGAKYDPKVVDALQAAYKRGEFKKHEARRSAFISVPEPTP